MVITSTLFVSDVAIFVLAEKGCWTPTN